MYVSVPCLMKLPMRERIAGAGGRGGGKQAGDLPKSSGVAVLLAETPRAFAGPT